MDMRRIVFTSGLIMTLIAQGCSQQVATTKQTTPNEPSAVPEESAGPTTDTSTRNGATNQPAPAMSQICQSDVLLLSHFPIKTLYGTPLPKTCCAPGVLPPDYWQCELDWPSSDAPACSHWQEMASALSKQLKAPPAWMTKAQQKMALENRAVLVTWHQDKYGCIP